MWSSRILLLATLVTILIGACAGTQPPRNSIEERVCVLVRDIHDFDPIDDQHLVVEARLNRYYFLTVEGCSGLSFARGISIADRSSQICGDGFDWLSFDQPGVGLKRCRVTRIQPVEDLEAARLLVSSLE